MTNTYLPDARWDELRDQIALRGLTPEDAANLVALKSRSARQPRVWRWRRDARVAAR